MIHTYILSTIKPNFFKTNFIFNDFIDDFLVAIVLKINDFS